MNDDFLVTKTVPTVYFLHLDPTDSTPGFWLNMAHITEIVQHRENSLLVKMLGEHSYTFSGIHAQQILAELEQIKRRYQ